MRCNNKFHQSGVILPIVLVIFTAIIFIATAILQLAFTGFVRANADRVGLKAQLAADAGIDYAVQQINEDSSWTSTTGELEIHSYNNIRSTVEVTTADSGDNKILTAVGRTYRPASSSTPESTRTIEVTIRPVDSGGNFSVVTGVGGLYMSNSAKILGGDVFVNGEIEMTNTAQIGLSSDSSPLRIDVANQNCPDGGGSEYPRVCQDGESDEPIQMMNSAHIYGDVHANNQINGSNMTDNGLQGPYLVNDTDNPPIAPEALPNHSRSDQIANVSTTTSDLYYTNCDATSEERTWPGRLKIEGDVYIGKQCKVTLEGDVWITGRLLMQNSAQLKIADSISLGSPNTVNADRPTIMIDGATGFTMQNSSELVENSGGVGAAIVTYWSRAACSPDCSNVTGSDLYASRGDRTIYLQNSAQAPYFLFYARWTQAELSNGGQIGAIVGQTVRLSNSAAITFNTSSGSGSGEPSYWVIDSYRRL